MISSGNLQRPRPHHPLKAPRPGPSLGPVYRYPDRCNLRLTPLEVGPNVSAAGSAALADKPRLNIGQPHLVGPAIGAQHDVMAAMAIDQDAAHTHLAHLTEGDLDRPAVGVRWRVTSNRARHTASKPHTKQLANYRFLEQNPTDLNREGFP